MKHLVFGTGLIGGFIGAGLMHAGHNVVFLGREKQKKAMSDGLIFSALDGTSTKVKAPKFYDATEPSTFDVIWLSVKCTAVENCINELQKLVNKDSIIVCCQNSFGSDAMVRSALPKVTVLNATVGFNVAQNAPNHLHRSTDGRLVVESHPKLVDLIQGLNTSILPTHSSDQITAERWAKLQLNIANPVNALADVPTKAMTEDREYRVVIAALMSELLMVTSAMKLALPKLTPLPAKWLPLMMRLPNFIYLKIAQKTLAIDPTARVSMWWDLSQGKRSEIDFLNAAVVEQGSKLSIDCPKNKRIVELIKEVESGQRKIGVSGSELQAVLGINKQ